MPTVAFESLEAIVDSSDITFEKGRVVCILWKRNITQLVWNRWCTACNIREEIESERNPLTRLICSFHCLKPCSIDSNRFRNPWGKWGQTGRKKKTKKVLRRKMRRWDVDISVVFTKCMQRKMEADMYAVKSGWTFRAVCGVLNLLWHWNSNLQAAHFLELVVILTFLCKMRWALPKAHRWASKANHSHRDWIVSCHTIWKEKALKHFHFSYDINYVSSSSSLILP